MGGVISSRVGQQSSKEQMDRRIKGVEGNRGGKQKRKKDRKGGQMMVEGKAGECFCKGTRAQNTTTAIC